MWQNHVSVETDDWCYQNHRFKVSIPVITCSEEAVAVPTCDVKGQNGVLHVMGPVSAWVTDHSDNMGCRPQPTKDKVRPVLDLQGTKYICSMPYRKVTVFYDKDIQAGRYIKDKAIKPDFIIWNKNWGSQPFAEVLSAVFYSRSRQGRNFFCTLLFVDDAIKTKPFHFIEHFFFYIWSYNSSYFFFFFFNNK